MSNLVLPSLSSTNQIAQAWPVKKSPSYSTVVQKTASKRGQNRISLAPNPTWNFELDLAMIRGDLNQSSPTSIQALLDFYGHALGAGNDWLYQDPYDNTATAQLIGYGDGSTTQFQIGRSIGGLSFEMMQNVFPTAVTVGGSSVPAGPQASGNFWYSGLENFLSYSQDFSQTAFWGVLSNGASGPPVVTPNFTAGPDGTTTASKIAFPSSVGGHTPDIFQTLTPNFLTAGETIVFSVWLKTDTTATANMEITDAVGQSANQAMSVTSSWQRFLVALTLNARTNGTVLPVLFVTNQAALNLYAWGAQIERNPTGTPSSYVMTTNKAPVTPRGVLTFATAPASGAAIAVTFGYYYRCHFLDDEWSDLNEFLYQYWELPSLKFESLIL